MITSLISCRVRALFKSVVYLFCFSVSLSIFAGCGAPITIKDDLPAGTPKGYVEFYYLRNEGDIGRRAAIYRYDKYRIVLEGLTSGQDWRQNKVGLRLAKRPGYYHFAVSLGTAEEHVRQVRVEEGMVTPVRIQIRNLGTKYSPYVEITYYTMSLIVEEPRPLTIDESNQ